MDDHQVMTQIRQSLNDVQMTVPVAAIVRQGDVLRVRRRTRWAGTAASVAVIAGAGVAGTVAATSGHAHQGHPAASVTSPAGHTSPGTMLAAWTVATAPDGTVDVTVRQMTDIPGLQAMLRADGVRAVVTSSPATPPGCSEWQHGHFRTGDVVTTVTPSGLPGPDGLELHVHPADIPDGALLWLGLGQTGAPAGTSGPAGPITVGFFTDTPTCHNS